jgi:hypothetical protein
MPQLLQLSPAAKAMTCCSASPTNAPMATAQKRFLMLDTQPLSAQFFSGLNWSETFSNPLNDLR